MIKLGENMIKLDEKYDEMRWEIWSKWLRNMIKLVEKYDGQMWVGTQRPPVPRRQKSYLSQHNLVLAYGRRGITSVFFVMHLGMFFGMF